MPPDVELETALGELPGNGKPAVDESDWTRRLQGAVKAGHLDPGDIPTQAEILRNWARFTAAMAPLERECEVSRQLGVMLDENARELVDAALAEADQERKTSSNGKPDGPRIVTAPEFALLAQEDIDYLVWGYVARGMITQLAAGIKVGKTVWMLDAVHQMLTGGEFLGHMTQKCPVLYMTEEGHRSFRRNLQQAQLLEQQDLHLLLRQEVFGMSWPEVGQYVENYVIDKKVGAICVDTLSDWANLAPDAEKDEGAARRVVAVLRQWCNVTGCAVVALQHERKGGGNIGDSARGSSAFGGAMDVLLVLREQTKERDRETHPNRRELGGRGRCDVPEPVIIEWEDHHYGLVGGASQTHQLDNEKAVVDCLPYKVSEEVDEAWISERAGIPRTTVRRVINSLRSRKVIARAAMPRSSGHGTRHVYWIGEDSDA